MALKRPVPATIFARPLQRQNLEQGGAGIPRIGSERKPWEGLSGMISETIGPVYKRKRKL